MKELLRRVQARPLVAVEMAFGSLLVNVLAMASPLFVMQILNRYVGQGVDATLFTLTSGVLIAIGFEFALRRSRLSRITSSLTLSAVTSWRTSPSSSMWMPWIRP